MRLDFGPLLLGLKSEELIRILQNIEFWSLGNVDDTNVKAGGLTGSRVLKDWSVNLKKLAWREIPIPLCKAIPAAGTATSADGGYFYYDPLRFPGGSWYLEALLKSNGTATATFTLKNGAVSVASVSTTSADWTLVRSTDPIQMPSDASTLTGALSSSDSTVTVYLLGASLIFVPS